MKATSRSRPSRSRRSPARSPRSLIRSSSRCRAPREAAASNRRRNTSRTCASNWASCSC